MKYYDTYFFNRDLALKEASKQHKIVAPNGIVKATQVCYYDGKKIKNAPYNCINVPFDKFVKYFTKTKNRIPTMIDNIKYQKEFDKKISKIKKKNNKKIAKLKEKIKTLKPNFQDKKLRIIGHGCRETVLIKYIIKNILKGFQAINCEVYLHTQNSDIQSCSQKEYLKDFYKFNPHIQININHFNNDYLNKDVFNFVWFQDMMSSFINKKDISLRDRDIVMYLTDGIKNKLLQSNIYSIYQPFCIDTSVYKTRKKIKREKKIVFIGNSYFKAYKNLQHKNKVQIFNEIYNYYFHYGFLTHAKRIKLSKKWNISFLDLSKVINYIDRDKFLEYIVSLNLDYSIEIYGRGWKKNKTIKPYYKGILKYGKDISKIYNSASYGLVLGGYILQQRTLEISASGAIPLVFDTKKDITTKEIDKKVLNNMLFFKTPVDIPKVLSQKNKNKYNLKYLVQNHSYIKFAKKYCKLAKGKNI